MNYFNVGKIVNTHGIRGEVRVISRTHFSEERYAPGSKLALFMPNSKTPIQLTVETHRQHKNFDLLTFENHLSIGDVEKYRDGVLKVAENQLTELEEGEFYYHEIIGCEVITVQGESIGTVTEILETGANDVWTVVPSSGKPSYIPYTDEIVKEIDIEEKKIIIEPMEGLLS